MKVSTKLVLMCVCVVGLQLVTAVEETWFSDRASLHQELSRNAHDKREQLLRIEAALIAQLKEVADLADGEHGIGELNPLVEIESGQAQVDSALMRLKLINTSEQALGVSEPEEAGERAVEELVPMLHDLRTAIIT